MWLKVHLANQSGQDKLSLDERLAWVEENMELVHAAASDPLGDTVSDFVEIVVRRIFFIF